MPAADTCVLPRGLVRLVERRADATCAVFDDGTNWTYAEILVRSLSVADALAQLGITRGETVMIWLPNGPLALKAWFGANCLGAVSVAINTAYRGGDDCLELCAAAAGDVRCRSTTGRGMLHMLRTGSVKRFRCRPGDEGSGERHGVASERLHTRNPRALVSWGATSAMGIWRQRAWRWSSKGLL